MKPYEELISEALTPQQRVKRSMIARKTARMRNVSRQRKKMRRKTEAELRTKTRKAARKHVKSKYMRGQRWEDLPYAAREQIEKMADKKRGAIERLTMRLSPFIRQGEDERLKKARKRR